MFFKKSKNAILRAQLCEEPIKFKGHKLYKFKSIDQMPKIREMALRLAWDKSELGCTISDLRAFVELFKQKLNEGDKVSQGALITALDGQIENYCSEKIILELGGCGILVDDEPVSKFSKEHNEIKRELLKDKEVYGFFLNSAMRYLKELNDKLDTSLIEASMKNPERALREATFLKLIHRNDFKNLWSDLTKS